MRVLASLLFVLVLASPAPVSPLAQDRTQAFLLHAVSVNRFQVESSRLALKKTQNPDVHGFAHQMVIDFSAAGMKLRQAAADAKLPLRDALDAGHKALMDHLTRTAPGKTLSRAYLETEERALREDLPAFEAYARSGDDERFKIYAQEMVPLLRGHLERIGKVRR